MRTLPEVQQVLEDIDNELARLQHPLAVAAEKHILAQGRADATIDAFIRDYHGPVGKAKNVAAAENPEVVKEAVIAHAKLEKGKTLLKVASMRLDANRSASSSLKAELEVLKGGYGP